MYCYKCGKQLIPGANFCSACGTPKDVTNSPNQQTYYSYATPTYSSPQPQPQQTKSLWACYVLSWKKWTTQGRATRREYWGAYLYNMLSFFAGIVLMAICIESGFSIIPDFLLLFLLIYLFAMSISTFCLTVRRLHDIGRPGWHYLVTFIPYAGSIILLIWMCQESKNDSTNPWHQ